MNDIIIRPSSLDDIPLIMPVYESAIRFMRQRGNMNQWTGGYPSVNIITHDILSGNHYIGFDQNGQAIVVFTFILGDDPTYSAIEDGHWLNGLPYGTIHRIASSGLQRDTLSSVLDFCFEKTDNIRIDTHADNLPMLTALQRHGFIRCGIIYIADGSPRIAFQKQNP